MAAGSPPHSGWGRAPCRSVPPSWPARNPTRRRCTATKLFSADARRTTLTRAFTGRLARSIHNGFIDAMHEKRPGYPPYPVHGWFMAHLRGPALEAGRTDLGSFWSGQGAPLLKYRRARELMEFLVADTARLLTPG